MASFPFCGSTRAASLVLSALLFAALSAPGIAHANCAAPAAAIGSLDFQTSVFKYCDGTNWLPLNSGGDFKADGSVLMTGTIKATLGTNALPGYTFSGDTDTGIYSPGANQLSITIGGASVAQFASAIQQFTGIVQSNTFDPTVYASTSATSASPSGSYVRVANTAGTNGEGAFLALDPLNAVPTHQAAYIGAISNAAGNTPNIVIGQQTGANAYAERLRINTSGDVSITSTTNAWAQTGQALNVAGGIGAIGNIYGAVVSGTTVSAAGGNNTVYTSTSASDPLPGITGTDAGVVQAVNNNNLDGSGSYLRARTTNTANNTQGFYIGAIANTGAGAYTPTVVIGQQTGANAYAERMRIDTSGNVGIGTTAPLGVLDVESSSANNGVTNNGFTSQVVIGSAVNHSSGPTAGIGFNIPYQSSTGKVSAGILAWKEDNVFGNNASSLGFYTAPNASAPVNRLTILSGGNVGIGTTSPAAKIDVNGGASLGSSYEGIAAYVNSAAAYTIPDTTLNIRRITLTANTTITLPAFTTPTSRVYSLTIFLKQDATGSRTVAWAGNGTDTIKWDAGAAPTISSTANKITIVTLTKPADETVWYGSMTWKEN